MVKPLIQYTLETAEKLMLDKNYHWLPFVSTDDEKISNFCARKGFDTKYKRPKEFAGDKSLMIDTIFDCLNWLYLEKNVCPDAVLLLQPTSPLRKTSKIINAIKSVSEQNFFSIVSVTRMREHPYECVVQKNKGWSYLSKPSHQLAGRQEYDDKYFFIDGSFYFASIDFLKTNQTFLIENITTFYLLNHRWPIDIDEPEDIIVAEAFEKYFH